MASACIEPYNLSLLATPDFEFFRLEDPSVTPADELFSDGKLVPLKRITTIRSPSNEPKPIIQKPFHVNVNAPDPVFSPRAPTCSIRWKNILRLKTKSTKALQTNTSNNSNLNVNVNSNTTSSRSLSTNNSNINTNPTSSRSLTSVLSRAGSKSSNTNVQKDSDTDSVSTSSRLSLSSSSSSHDTDENVTKQDGRRGVVLADSPRLNSSGKVVFERSSSSPGSFTGGPRNKHSSGIERSYSAHVRVAPVLNVPVVCSLRGSSKFGFPLFATHKGNGNGRVQRRNSKNGSGSGTRNEQA